MGCWRQLGTCRPLAGRLDLAGSGATADLVKTLHTSLLHARTQVDRPGSPSCCTAHTVDLEHRSILVQSLVICYRLLARASVGLAHVDTAQLSLTTGHRRDVGIREGSLATMRYRLAKTLNHTHTQGVTQVAFSSDGCNLATADLGGKLCLWDASTWKLLYSYTSGTSILSLAWAEPVALFCGLGDGTIVRVRAGKEEFVVEGEWCHSFPVEHLSLDQKRIASGAHRELFIWKASLLSIQKEIELPVPCDDSDDSDEVLITGLHWHGHKRRDASMLITSYMHHGIYIYNSYTWSAIRRLGEHSMGFMATSSLSPDGGRIVVSNLVNGVDVYDTDTGALVLTVPHEVGKGHPLPVTFIHGGHAIASGNGLGCVKVWYVDGASSRKLQTLPAPGNNRVLSLGGYYDATTDQFLLVAGTMGDEPDSAVLLWKAEEPRPRDLTVAGRELSGTARSLAIRILQTTIYLLSMTTIVSAVGFAVVHLYPYYTSHLDRNRDFHTQTSARSTILLDIRDRG
ncbi:hypothetical protein NUW54_g4405 [Trametes sanguinea]|uniref:Uncharacterized protein n=1 Tax=Trametes sanguinea TaxID=158606 RepID=A0ACC1PZ98_9APHY|nr:hypothetical protein NUW54_g4405 [Trametes sanguinea]